MSETMPAKESEMLFQKAKNLIPGGVNSPVRAFQAVGGHPLFIKQAEGAFITDEDGNRMMDFVGSFGPLIAGHARREVVEAVRKAAGQGTTYGAPCRGEVELAEMICDAVPSIEQVRMVNSGTEATMSAVRLARACTGRDKFIKFEGCYHGHGDGFLVKAGSGMLTEKIPASPGIPGSILEHTLVCQYNDLYSVRQAFNDYPGEIAAVIVEPVPANMGLVLPKKGFLEGLRRITEENKALLIFDEVITGFRTCYGGYQNIAGVTPDLTTLGKIIGGGLPVGAYGGRRDLMYRVAPSGSVYQAGTLSGNPLVMAAGCAVLNILRDTPDFYKNMAEKTQAFVQRIRGEAEKQKVPVVINQLASLFTIFFTERGEVSNYGDVCTADTDKFRRFHHELLQGGIYFPPSQFEVAFLSSAHQKDELETAFQAVSRAFQNM